MRAFWRQPRSRSGPPTLRARPPLAAVLLPPKQAVATTKPTKPTRKTARGGPSPPARAKPILWRNSTPPSRVRPMSAPPSPLTTTSVLGAHHPKQQAATTTPRRPARMLARGGPMPPARAQPGVWRSSTPPSRGTPVTAHLSLPMTSSVPEACQPTSPPRHSFGLTDLPVLKLSTTSRAPTARKCRRPARTRHRSLWLRRPGRRAASGLPASRRPLVSVPLRRDAACILPGGVLVTSPTRPPPKTACFCWEHGCPSLRRPVRTSQILTRSRTRLRLPRRLKRSPRRSTTRPWVRLDSVLALLALAGTSDAVEPPGPFALGLFPYLVISARR
mmetsp:Transcript_3738/g.11225  ORF Transcript_3738/g.11225 Transcript_3738/m.11225 type:complete len:331 (+) Transcript_3738:399-1391(+)